MSKRTRQISRLARNAPYKMRADGTPIVPEFVQTDLPSEAVVYSGPLPAWAQSKIDVILEGGTDRDKDK